MTDDEDEDDETFRSSRGNGKGKGKELVLAEAGGGAEKKNRRKKKKRSRKGKSKGKGKGKEAEHKKESQQKTLAQLKKLAQKNAAAKRQYLRRLRRDFVMSAKIQKTIDLLRETMEGTDEKVIIFSQWTSLLDLLEVPIDDQNWPFERYDGSMSAKERADAVDNFKASHSNPPPQRAPDARLAQGRQRGPEPHGRQPGHHPRPLLEPLRRGAGHRPRAQARPGQGGQGAQAAGRGDGRGPHHGAAGAEEGDDLHGAGRGAQARDLVGSASASSAISLAFRAYRLPMNRRSDRRSNGS
ncbi:hypothetical protein MRB53_041456 [Persea americana]|nr:hypothetical protein MRB53_041456 [Persea americana]